MFQVIWFSPITCSYPVKLYFQKDVKNFMINIKKGLVSTHNVNMYGFGSVLYKCTASFFLTIGDKPTLNLLHQCMETHFFSHLSSIVWQFTHLTSQTTSRNFRILLWTVTHLPRIECWCVKTGCFNQSTVNGNRACSLLLLLIISHVDSSSLLAEATCLFLMSVHRWGISPQTFFKCERHTPTVKQKKNLAT